MIQFKDIHGNCWAFVRTNISLIFYTSKSQEGISHVRVTTIDSMVYSFDIDWNDAGAIKES